MDVKNKELELTNKKALAAIDEANEKAKKAIEKKTEEADKKIEEAQEKVVKAKSGEVASAVAAKAGETKDNDTIKAIRDEMKALSETVASLAKSRKDDSDK